MEYALVKSVAGHDKGSWYAVVKREDSVVYIADGRRRKLAAPKRKNIKHVAETNKTVRLDYFTDKSLRKALWQHNFGNGAIEDRAAQPQDSG